MWQENLLISVSLWQEHSVYSAAEQRVLDAIDDQGLLDFLCELVSIRSLSGQEGPAQERMADKMAEIGLELDVWELDFETLREHPAFCVEVDRASGLGVVGSTPAAPGGKRLIFNGHVDVVPAGDLAAWSYPPWRGTVANGRVYGRGALDMKGGLCCALFAAKAIRDSGVNLAGQLSIQSVIGEEDGGVGTLATVLRGHTGDGAVVVEPTECKVAPAHAGAMGFRVTIQGLSAHACVREEGRSAIEGFLPIYQGLIALERRRNAQMRHPLFQRYDLPYALSIGTLTAGDWPSTVPERLSFEGRYGLGLGEDAMGARRQFEEAVSEAARSVPWLRDRPPTIEWWGGQFAPAEVGLDDPIVTTVSDALADLTGHEPVLEGMPYGADMRLLVNVGKTPTVLFGPGDVRRAHRPDEWVGVGDLRLCTRALALTALRFLGVK